jgi:hypothetical protein
MEYIIGGHSYSSSGWYNHVDVCSLGHKQPDFNCGCRGWWNTGEGCGIEWNDD